MYPFTDNIGKMKVSQAIPLLSFIAKDWNLNLTQVPDYPGKIHSMVWRGPNLRTATRILKNSVRNN